MLATAMYMLTLAAAVVLNPTTFMWRINDEYDLTAMGPDWYWPALMAISIMASVSLAIWMIAKLRSRPFRIRQRM